MSSPHTIGKYQIDRRLGGGGMAEVFLAKRVGAEGFSRKVAIKRVLPGVSAPSTFASLFISEAKLSAQLHHPNIVAILDFDRDPEHGLFLVMELGEGRDLAELLSAGRLPLPLSLYIIAEVLLGLGHAHSPPDEDNGLRGVVHRDMSPHNVLLSWEGAVKISDFGIAKARAASQATASMFIKGKPTYMSPEQANGESLDGRSDLFAVGVMLWEMLVGRSLFGRDTLQETLAALFTAPIPTPSSLCSEVPEDVSQVVMRLLHRDRAQRYPTAAEARRELLACGAVPRDGRADLAELLQVRFGGRAADRARAPTLVASSSLPLAAATPSPQSVGTPLPLPAEPIAPRASAGTTQRVRISSRLGLMFVATALTAGVATVGVVLLTRVQRDQPAAASPPAPLEREPAGAEESREPANASKENLRRSDADAGPVLGAETGEKGADAASSTEPLPRHPTKPGRSPAPKTAPSRGASQPKDSGIVDLRVE